MTLIVEDDLRLSRLTSALLEDSGYAVSVAHSAHEAISQLERVPSIETMVTDIGLGAGPTGIDLAHDVSERWPAIGLIVTSGRPLFDCARLPEGCLFLSKPYRPSELLALVASFHENP